MFASVDAGKTWKEVSKQAHMVEMADHGSVIVMVNDEQPVNTVKYSLNYGSDFSDLDITNSLNGGQLRIQSIITEPSATTNHFVLIGKIRGGSNDSSYAAISLDFSKIWSRNCVFADDLSKSDFETWSPSDSCMFGARVY